MISRRDRLVNIIEWHLRTIRESNGFKHTAEQVADAIIAKLPVTAQQVTYIAYLDQLATERQMKIWDLERQLREKS